MSKRILLAMLIAVGAGAAPLAMTTLSSQPQFVSGGDALVEIRTADPKLEVKLNGVDVRGEFALDKDHGVYRGLVKGLKLGANTLTAKAGAQTAKLELTNHAITGPILAGDHLSPFVCKTEESGLGAPLDADCSAATKIERFYKSTNGKYLPMPEGPRPSDVATVTTTQGKTLPFIVRVESGTINRSIYRIAMLEDGWNHRIYYSFGGGCGAQYNQGTITAASVLADTPLSRGYAHITSTQNVLQQHCNDALSGEAVMMIKEHFIKTYGVPEWTMGSGGSGGSIQQLLIAQNYPGLLDGLLPSLTFPDSASLAPDVNECTLLEGYFKKNEGTWSKEKQTAVEGYSTGTCGAWVRSFAATIVANNVRGCGISPELVFDAIKNPKGARCSTWDTNVASYGRDPVTGFARWPIDNVGVQYGLKALNDGVISKQEFIDLNKNVGGFDRNGMPHAERTPADMEAVKLAYTTGRVDSAAGGLPNMPILHYRSYNDAAGDIHDRVRDFVVRERLRKATGRFDNEVIWIYGGRGSATKVAADAIDTMAAWLDGIKKSDAKGKAIDRVVQAKPAAAVDACWTPDGARINEPAVFGQANKCNELYPIHLTPRLVAGAPLSDDVMKCQLKGVNPRDYKVVFTPAELDQLHTVFPGGVCDFSKPGAMQQTIKGTYQVLPMTASNGGR